MKYLITLILPFFLLSLSCSSGSSAPQEEKDRRAVQRQQAQYAKSQEIPSYKFSLERDLLTQLYNIRNEKVATHSVWRSDMGIIEGDCPSFGFGLPYDTSLTNPYQLVDRWSDTSRTLRERVSGIVGQAEPNGVFASTNTSATWVMCIGSSGMLEPHYIEAKVTAYPGSVTVDYDKNRVIRTGKASVTIKR